MIDSESIRISSFGGPEVLQVQKVTVPPPSPGCVCVEHTAIGLNMIDTYFRSGLYPLDLPSGLGSEAAGIVGAVGDGVTGFAIGDRVAYAAPPPLDAYSQRRNIDARWLVGLPENVTDQAAAAMMLKGLTSWYLLNRSYAVQAGDWIVLYAAAGGVGLIAAQWAKTLGARVIGIVGSEAKRRTALAAGCEVVLLASEDIAARVRELTHGEGVSVVYDSVGRSTFIQSLDCLRPHGVMVSFGNSSGPVEPVAPIELTKRGSLYLTRPTLFDFIRRSEDLAEGAQALFDLVGSGAISISVKQKFALAEAANAHAELAGRRTTGSTILIP